MQIAGMGDFRDQVPASLPEHERIRRNYQQFIKHYYRVLLGVDENVGRVLDFLDEQGLAEDTIVVYSSDNGFFLGHHRSEEHTSELQSLMRISYAVFCLKKKLNTPPNPTNYNNQQ